MDDEFGQALASVGPRLRALRRQRETTLADLSAATGISVSTLSRLESGARRPTLELLVGSCDATAALNDRGQRVLNSASSCEKRLPERWRNSRIINSWR